MIELLRVALRNLMQQRARSLLTLLGVIIGIAAIVALVSVGEGLQYAVNEQFEKMGMDKIMVMPGSPDSPGLSGMMFGMGELTDRDVKIIEKVGGVEMAAPMILESAIIEMGRETAYTYVAGMPVEKKIMKMIEDMQGYEIRAGRDLTESDKYAALIGYGVENDLFDKNVRVRDKIKINGRTFRVVGVMEKIGSRMDDLSIIIPLEQSKEVLNKTDYFYIIVDVKNGEDVSKVAEKIKHDLKKDRNAEDFNLQTSEQLKETAASILGIIQAVFVGIAAISLVVGGIGIMNTMLMAVMERTREIGVMKAIGATEKRIMSIFLVESALIGLLGGVLGIALGSLVSYGVSLAATSYTSIPIKTIVAPYLVVGALAFSMVVGVISGAYPARRAARMDPVEALRWE